MPLTLSLVAVFLAYIAGLVLMLTPASRPRRQDKVVAGIVVILSMTLFLVADLLARRETPRRSDGRTVQAGR